ncbi:MAG: hypothetical protein KTR21_00415 [Rhodobacteraceae bacterium]|nr:hypothetical protein [Paracoccaceae bacterium]
MFRIACRARLCLILTAALTPLAGCGGILEDTAASLETAEASEEVEVASAESPEGGEPEWKVGYTWPLMDDRRLYASTKETIEQCLIGRVARLEDAELRQTDDGFEVVDRETEEPRLWMRIGAPPGEPQARRLDLNWSIGVGQDARVRLLRSIDAHLKLKQPCTPRV